MNHRLLTGDCREVLATMDENSVDAVVTDPPYGIGFMGKKWDQPGAFVERMPERANRFDHIGGNHNPSNAQDAARTAMVENQRSQAWHESWAREVIRVMKPGAYLLAFGGTRTHHRLTCAIEDAGFEIHDGLCWLYGSGFPKSKNLGNGLGTALKPAWEPIVLAQKPRTGSYAANVERWGVGGLRIDDNRIGSGGQLRWAEPRDMGYHGGTDNGRVEALASTVGRWPANLLLDEEAAALLDASVRPSRSRIGKPRHSALPGDGWGMTKTGAEYDDAGGPSRFFYCAKASRTEREAGLDDIEIVSVELAKGDELSQEDFPWGDAGLKVKLRVDTGQSLPKVIVASTTRPLNATAWSTWLFGSGITAPSLLGSMSTIATITSSTTTSRTLSYLISSLTNVSIAAVNSEAENGGSPAENAEPSGPSLSFTNAETVFLPDVGRVPSGTRWTLKGNAGSPADHPTVKPIELMRYLVRLVTPSARAKASIHS